MSGSRAKALAVAAMLVMAAGCGEQDTSEIRNPWTAMENDLTEKLAAVQTTHGEIQARLQTATAGLMPDDTVVAAERASLDGVIADHDRQLAEIEAMIQEHSEKLTLLSTTGERAEMETAWNVVRPDYESAMKTLTEIQRRNEELMKRIDSWSRAGLDTAGTPEADTTGTAADTAAK